MKAVDLHTHSNKSDGTMTPSSLVDYAVSKGLSAIALTDHDTMDGIAEAMKRGQYHKENGYDIEVIPGIEFSTEYYGSDVHIVGLYLDFEGDYIKGRLKHFVDSREKRNRKLCQKLTDGNMPVTYEEMLEEFPNSILTRAHFANILQKKGYVKSKKEAFDRFLGDGKPYHIPRSKISPFRAVEIIRRAGGFPVLAHPVLYGFSKSKLETLVSRMADMGLMGIEAIYSTYTPSDERDIRALAKKYNLAISGGSDYHGTNKPDIDLGTGKGRLFIPETDLAIIKDKHKEMLTTNSDYFLPKILFTDLDGTLLRNDKTISAYTHDLLKRWTDKGHSLAICSGRDITSCNRVIEELGFADFKNIYSIGYNGGYIMNYSTKECINRIGLNREDVRYLFNEAQKDGLYFHTYEDDHFIVPYDGEETAFYTRVIKTRYEVCEDLPSALTKDPCKCLLINLHDRNKLDRYIERMSGYCKEHGISMMYSNPRYVEVIPSISGKGAAVEILSKKLSIPGLVTVGAGDEQNDYSMLKTCDIAIAMSNGIDLLKDIATTISEEDNEHDGLALTLEGML